jgi:single-strand DNA-binding protein
MSERNATYQHPEWNLPGAPKALIGQDPVPAASSDVAEDLVSNAPRPETQAENPLDIPSLIRLFQTDAYPLPESAPVRIAVSKEATLTLYPNNEAIEYQQQTKDHAIYLRAGKSGEFAFSLTPVQPVRETQVVSQISPEDSRPDTVPVSDDRLRPTSGETTELPENQNSTHHAKGQAEEKENKERVVITGRVGRESTTKQIKTRVMAKFPVAEHQPDGTTTWHTIVAFGKTAEGLRDSLAKGRTVTVAGYPHEQEVTGKAGQKRTVTEVYLAGLKHHK